MFRISLAIVLLVSVLIIPIAGAAPTPSISGTVVDDKDQALSGWVVSLSSKQKSAPTTKHGYWAIDTVAPGNYTLTLESGKGYNYYIPQSGKLNITLGTKPQSYTFKVTKRGAIVGRVIYDSGEAMPGWTVTLQPKNVTTTSDKNGEWGFPFLDKGHYEVTLTMQDGYVAVKPKAAGNPPVVKQLVTVKSAVPIASNPFVVTARPSLEVRVSTFPSVPLSGWKLDLKQKGEVAVLRSGKTGKSGSVSFENLDPGKYTVTVTLQKGFILASPKTSNIDVEITKPTRKTIDFKLGRQGAIFGTIYQEREKFAEIQRDSPRLSNWKIYIDKNNNGILDKDEPQTVSDKRGAFSFDEVGTGAFSLQLVTQKNWRITQPATNGYSISLRSRFQNAHHNFGVQEFASLGGTVFADANKNGMMDKGEQGLPSWVVTADGPSGKITATSGADGTYTVPQLVQGSYKLSANPKDNKSKGQKQTTPIVRAVKFNSVGRLDGIYPDGRAGYAYISPDSVGAFSPSVSGKLDASDLPLRVRITESFPSPDSPLYADWRAWNFDKRQWTERYIAYGISTDGMLTADLDTDGYLDTMMVNIWRGVHYEGQVPHTTIKNGGLVVSFGNSKAHVSLGPKKASYILLDFITPDQYPDLLSLALDRKTLNFSENLGTRKFKSSNIALGHLTPFDIATEDSDQDGYKDLFIVSADGLYLAINDGSGQFSSFSQIVDSPWSPSSRLRVADFNGDNYPDIVVQDGNPKSSSKVALRVFLNDKLGGFYLTFADNSLTSHDHAALFFADIDGDGDNDAVGVSCCTTGKSKNSVFDAQLMIYQNLSNARFQKTNSNVSVVNIREKQKNPDNFIAPVIYDLVGSSLPDIAFLRFDPGLNFFSDSGGIYTLENATTSNPGNINHGFVAGKQEKINFGFSP